MADALTSGASFVLLFCASAIVSGQLRYSIPEEMELGGFVGNVAEDVSLSVWELSARNFRLISDEVEQYLQVNVDNGILFVRKRIDREQLCRQSLSCSLSFQIVLYDPEEMHSFTVEILDINDNSPTFQNNEFALQINELIAPGTGFPFESASDPDVGTNAINTYQISPNEHFSIIVQTRRGGSKTAELLLQKPLDREQQATFQLILTAIDGGNPSRSGTARIIITVEDGNDNTPVFDHENYSATLAENVPKGTVVTKINAVDVDEGRNAEITDSFTNHVTQMIRQLFKLDPRTGYVRVEGTLNFEKFHFYELDVQATDKGFPALTGHAKVIVTLLDVNDNAPAIHVISSSRTVPENTLPGTVVARFSVTDLDTGVNGQVHCQVSKEIPFALQRSSSNDYNLVTNDVLNREATTIYNISILAQDGGSPPLSTQKSVFISVSDINDNKPQFTQSTYNVFVTENNTPGSSIFSVSALDSDIDENGDVTYAVLNSIIDQNSHSRRVMIHSKSGNIYALISFDYEELKHFQFQVQAQDSGSPPMSSTATVNVIILDQNDNAPTIVSPSILNGSISVDIAPQSVYPGYLITKVIATDADTGQNARLSFQLLEGTDPGLLTVDVISGEIRATRSFRDQELMTSRLVLLVKDSGQPSLSSTATIIFSILPNSTVPSSESSVELRETKNIFNLNLYLIIIFGSTTFLFLGIIILLVMLKLKQDGNINKGCSSGFCCYNPRSSDSTIDPRTSANEGSSYVRSGQTEGYRYTVCLSPESSKTDFLFLKPYNSTLPFNELGVLENSTRK